ncbi:cupin domain-containing protein [Veronia pacifica]|uniref:Cupin n=1 Tax=Veronia pacifica TaxID=1080227 RepID=A0A1C3EG92_9GAMM|nr:cupin domain-containing protein [Veronia pacifica]ODA32250.1 cupin [Veronia pacifica]
MHNMLYERRVVVDTQKMPWEADKESGVYSKPLAFENTAKGHNSKILRLSPDISTEFEAHFGSEILILNGECDFMSESKSQRAVYGDYLRFPPGVPFTISSHPGCIMLVKQNQFSATDQKQSFVSMSSADWTKAQGELEMLSLHEFNGEQVALIKWPAGKHFFSISHFCGEEVFVLSGEYRDEFGVYPAGTWMRNPHMFEYNPFCQEDTLLWIKVGHLPYPG